MTASSERDSVVLNALRSCRQRLRAFIARRTDSAADTDDILQEISYRLIKADSYLNPIEQISAWLFRAARNELIDRSRKTHELPLVDIEEDEWPEGDELADILFGAHSSVEDAYLRDLVWDALASALEAMPAAQREAFEKTELQGYSFKRLSAESGVAVDTLLSRKHQAVLFLRIRLQTLYEAITER